jgi:hypothetical protein
VRSGEMLRGGILNDARTLPQLRSSTDDRLRVFCPSQEATVRPGGARHPGKGQRETAAVDPDALLLEFAADCPGAKNAR